MADIRPNQLPDAVPFSSTDKIIVDQNASGVRKAEPAPFIDFVAPIASQSEAEAGTINHKRMTPLRTKQSIAAEVGVTIASVTQGNKADSAVQTVNGLIGPDVIIDKSDIGLGDVDNTSDMDKPVSTATQAAIDSATAGLFPEFNTLADLQAATVPNEINVVSVIERDSGRGGGAVWKRSAEEPNVPSRAKVQDASGEWWSISTMDSISLEQLGGYPHVVCEAETLAWYNACVVKPTYMHLIYTDRFIRRLKWRGIWEKTTQLLCLAGHNLADGVINLKSPGVLNATNVGSLTLFPGAGTVTDNSTGYMTLGPWSSLVSQNAAFMAVSSSMGQPEAVGYLVGSLTGASLIGIRPRNVTNYIARLNSSTVMSTPVDYRGGVSILNRSSAASFDLYLGGLKLLTQPAVSAPVTTEIASIFVNDGTYSNDLVKVWIVGNQALTEIQANALDFYINEFQGGLSGVVNRGPSVASIGFDVKTTDAEMSDVFNDSAVLSSITGATVRLGHGYYISNARYPMVGGASLVGSHRQGSCIRLSSGASQGEPLFAPTHYNGGECYVSIKGLTLDGAYSERGHSGFGPGRPGASGVSTNGSSVVDIEDLDILSVGLHGVDICNTGELKAGVREYVADPLPTKRIAGVPSTHVSVKRVAVENQGDDAVTAHYSHDMYVNGVRAIYGRDTSTINTGSMGFEADDGSYNVVAKNIYSRGNAFGAASKMHDGHPAPSNVYFENITLDGGYGRALWITGDTSGLSNHGSNIRAHNINLFNPMNVAGSETIIVHITSNAKDVIVRNILGRARASDNFLYNAIYVSGAASNVQIDGFTVEGWATTLVATGETIRVTSGCSDVRMQDGKVTGCGKIGLWDSGSTRGDYDNITLQGTGVSASVGFTITGSTATNKTTNRAIKIISGFTTETNITP